MLKLAIKNMTELLLTGNLCYDDVTSHHSTPRSRNFIPNFQPDAHRYLELVMLVNGQAGLRLGSRTIKLTSNKVWAILPHVIHSEGCFGKLQCYSLLWVIIVSRGVNFFINEFNPARGSQVTHRLSVEFTRAGQLWGNACNSDLTTNLLIRAQFSSDLLAVCVQALTDIDKLQILWPSQQEQIVLQVQDYLKKHFRENITIPEMASFAGYTPNYLSKLFQRYTNQSIHQYLIELRLDLAMQLLQQGQHQIKEVAFLAGFNDQLYFSRLFRKNFSKSPSEILKHKN